MPLQRSDCVKCSVRVKNAQVRSLASVSNSDISTSVLCVQWSPKGM